MATAVTRPLLDTVATKGCDEAQVTVRPLSGLPCPSFGCAEYCDTSPGWKASVGAVRVTAATGTSATVTVTFAAIVSLVAETVVVPGATAVTSPLAETVATVGCDEAQVTVRPDNALPCASFGCAEYCEASPTSKASFGAVMATEETGTGTTV